jgi:hypothetical protein
VVSARGERDAMPGTARDAETRPELSILDDEGLLDLRGRARATDPAAVAAEERSHRRSLPSRNEDLAAWRPPEADAPAAADDSAAATAAAGSVCHVDGARAARYECKQCGRPMCAEHTWVMFSLCTACATEDRIRRWHASARPEDANWLDGPR